LLLNKCLIMIKIWEINLCVNAFKTMSRCCRTSICIQNCKKLIIIVFREIFTRSVWWRNHCKKLK
jgi:hypothetical protein